MSCASSRFPGAIQSTTCSQAPKRSATCPKRIQTPAPAPASINTDPNQGRARRSPANARSADPASNPERHHHGPAGAGSKTGQTHPFQADAAGSSSTRPTGKDAAPDPGRCLACLVRVRHGRLRIAGTHQRESPPTTAAAPPQRTTTLKSPAGNSWHQPTRAPSCPARLRTGPPTPEVDQAASCAE